MAVIVRGAPVPQSFLSASPIHETVPAVRHARLSEAAEFVV